MRIHVTAVHARHEVEHAAGLAALQDDVIQGEGGRVVGVRALEPRFEHEALVRGELAGQHVPDAVQHFLGRNVGEKAQTATVDAQQRDVATACKLSGIEHCAVPADGDDQVCGFGQHRLGKTPRFDLERHVLGSEHLDAGLAEVFRECRDRLGHARILVTSQDRYFLEHCCHLAFASASAGRGAV